MEHFSIKHTVQLRMPLELFKWLRRNEQGLPVSTCAIRLLAELAQKDLSKDADDGDLRTDADPE